MKQGDFTGLAKQYANRPGYAKLVLNHLLKYTGVTDSSCIADVGAGTGKLHEGLLDLGCSNITAVEPNEDMRNEGKQATEHRGVIWREGTGEATGLPPQSVDWVLMASSFHWTDASISLPEFYRILKPGGYLTVLWNPRHLEASPLQLEIDAMIRAKVPNLKRVSSGSQSYTQNIEATLTSTGHFTDVIHIEAGHAESMSPARYLGAWRSVNDIQAQAGRELFADIMTTIEQRIADMNTIITPYRTRSWTATRIG